MLADLLEEWMDTLLYLVLLIGFSLFFICFWSSEIKEVCADIVIDEFLTETSVDGKITVENYAKLIQNLKQFHPESEVSINWIHYEVQPVYALFSKESIAEYYLARNVKKEKKIPEESLFLPEENPEELVFQTETNASLIAAGYREYLPLPQEGINFEIEAVRPFQEVYVGEPLISLCYVNDSYGSFYAEAKTVTAEQSGVLFLQLTLMDQNFCIPVEVKCHPRTVLCENGHEVVNTKEVISHYQMYNSIRCPYCSFLPRKITCNVPVIYRKTGSRLDENIWIEAEYLDGHTMIVTSDSEEWTDTYDENYCGIQQVEIFYRGVKTYVTVVSENDVCQQCEGACNERCYMDYQKFPYCITCMEKVALFAGHTYEEEQKIQNSEVLDRLDETGEVLMNAEDYIVLCVTSGRNYYSIQQKKVLRTGK